MTLKNFFTGRIVGFSIFMVIVCVVGGFYILNSYIYKEKRRDNTPIEPYRATLTGIQICLPHKDTSGPQTLECALGIETDENEYYALDFNLMSQMPTGISHGERFTASGVITPIIRLSTDHWQKYNVQGIFSVTDSVSLEKNTDIPVFAWKYNEADSLSPDGTPETIIILSVTYSDGKVETKTIDTIAGGCNELSDSIDSVPGSKSMQCYSAGLGYRFKITKGNTSYLIERKTFEEALPDYNPPSYEYKVVAEFPLS
jgi:hypothetical protein